MAELPVNAIPEVLRTAVNESVLEHLHDLSAHSDVVAAFKARALATGAAELSQAGPDWVSVAVFRDDWPEPDLRFWARKAYLYART